MRKHRTNIVNDLMIEFSKNRKVAYVNMELTDSMWWGYIHENDSIQVKRYFYEDDLRDARISPFVKRVYGPFSANSRDDAIKAIRQLDNGIPYVSAVQKES